ncbi:MAG: hypothetical protein JWM59_1217 [Verrucomicrobiales bacterium]|nr:hypothetical protein [Verrucomicrobiales bacterium]
MHTVTNQRSITNTCPCYLLVADSAVIIGSYDSAEDAKAAQEAGVPNIKDADWGALRVIAPGETDSCAYTQTVPLTTHQKAEVEAGHTPPGFWVV